jgi:hypothetical protein
MRANCQDHLTMDRMDPTLRTSVTSAATVQVDQGHTVCGCLLTQLMREAVQP